MRNLFIIIFIAISYTGFAQHEMPRFLQGTWQIEGQDVFEHWDLIADNKFKGFSYSSNSTGISVIEHLVIEKDNSGISLTATVNSNGSWDNVNFKLVESSTQYRFENLEHDFPRQIIYNLVDDNKINIMLTDGKEKVIAYSMHKLITPEDLSDSIANPNYDPALAARLGADDYGMKSYVFAILTTGANKSSDQKQISKSFRGHLDNISRLASEGKLVVAGPLGKNDMGYRGIYIFDVKTIEEAEQLVQSDPAITQGFLDVELFQWYGSAALPLYLEPSEKIWKLKP
jgi:uncharacterized protein YciI